MSKIMNFQRDSCFSRIYDSLSYFIGSSSLRVFKHFKRDTRIDLRFLRRSFAFEKS